MSEPSVQKSSMLDMSLDEVIGEKKVNRRRVSKGIGKRRGSNTKISNSPAIMKNTRGEVSGKLRKLIMRNIDRNVSSAQLRKMLSEFGSIYKMFINVDKQGISTGVAEIEFYDENSAFLAYKKFNESILNGNVLKVDLVNAESSTSMNAGTVDNPERSYPTSRHFYRSKTYHRIPPSSRKYTDRDAVKEDMKMEIDD